MISSSELKQLELQSAELVRKAGKIVSDAWGTQKNISYKDARDIFTEVDIQSEAMLREELGRLLPHGGFIVEEGKTEKKEIYNWTIDPLDGSKNFAYHLPMFYVQIALLEQETPVLGVVYHPLSGQLFSASRGNGVRYNGKSIGPLDTRDISQAIIDVDLGGKDSYADENSKILKNLFQTAYRIRVSGGAFPTYLVTGAIDGYVVLNNKTKLVDQAPRIIIFREAGLTTEYVLLGEREILISGHEALYQTIRNCILQDRNT